MSQPPEDPKRPPSFFATPPRYQTFLLTLWEERNQDPDLPSVWRFRLENPRTGKQRGFANLETLMTMLAQEIGHKPDETDAELDQSSIERGDP
jgi:hypothetical protein